MFSCILFAVASLGHEPARRALGDVRSGDQPEPSEPSEPGREWPRLAEWRKPSTQRAPQALNGGGSVMPVLLVVVNNEFVVMTL